MNESAVEIELIDSICGDDEVAGAINCEDETINMNVEEYAAGRKRNREENSSEEGWTTVGSRRKLAKSSVDSGRKLNEKIQICVSSTEPLPKQFTLARLFKENNISHVSHVKYVHQYRIHITFDKESSADQFLQCNTFTKMGWRCRKTSEVDISYGLIKNVDLDISDEELLKSISCDYEIVFAKRLNRRNHDAETSEDQGWTPSETVRLGFKGSLLPAYVFIFDMRIKVEPFIFPVTQCSRCWKYGHSQKMCPSKQVVCPKCAENHQPCATSTFSCVNCKGSHIAVDKICPVYVKERKLRELMAELNCTYRKALTVYVPPSSLAHETSVVPEDSQGPESEGYTAPEPTYNSEEIHLSSDTPTYKEVVERVCPKKCSTKSKSTNRAKKSHRPPTPSIIWLQEVSSSSEEIEEPPLPSTSQENTPSVSRSKSITFKQLLIKIKHIVMNNESLEKKIQQVVASITEWLINIICDNLSCGSIFNLFFNNG